MTVWLFHRVAAFHLCV